MRAGCGGGGRSPPSQEARKREDARAGPGSSPQRTGEAAGLPSAPPPPPSPPLSPGRPRPRRALTRVLQELEAPPSQRPLAGARRRPAAPQLHRPPPPPPHVREPPLAPAGCANHRPPPPRRQRTNQDARLPLPGQWERGRVKGAVTMAVPANEWRGEGRKKANQGVEEAGSSPPPPWPSRHHSPGRTWPCPPPSPRSAGGPALGRGRGRRTKGRKRKRSFIERRNERGEGTGGGGAEPPWREKSGSAGGGWWGDTMELGQGLRLRSVGNRVFFHFFFSVLRWA